MKKYILFIVCLLFFAKDATAQVFQPYIEMSQRVDATHVNSWSGVIYGETEQTYKALSCAHGIGMDLETVQITIYNDNARSSFKSIGISGKIKKINREYDLSLVEIEKFDRLFKIKTHPLSKNRPKDGDPLVIRGFALMQYKEVNVTLAHKAMEILPMKYKTETCRGTHYTGMSGSPLLTKDNEIVGIQLAKNERENTGEHASLYMIEDFLGEHILSR